MKKNNFTAKAVLGRVFAGVIAGFLNGLFGGGGGMVVVPCLKYACGYDSKKAHATALLIMLPLSLLSGILYISFGNVDLGSSLFVTIGVTAGGAFGAVFLKNLKSKAVAVIFSLIMAAAGAKLLFF